MSIASHSRTAVLCAAISAPAAAQTDHLDLDFKGGTAQGYIAALQQSLPGLNVVQHGDVESVPISAVSLRNANAFTALLVLDDLIVQLDDRDIKVEIDQLANDPTASPIYVVSARTQLRRADPQRPALSRILSLADLIDHEVKVDAVLSAIETALSLHDGLPAAKIRYHEDTALLIVLAHPDQVNTIEQVLDELRRGLAFRQHDSDQAQRQQALEDRVEQLTKTNAVLQNEARSGAAQAEALRVRMEALMQELSNASDTINDQRKQIAALQHDGGG